MIKLIAIDLDGTLLNDQKQISARNQAALQAAKEQGVKIVLCTGRPLMAIHPYIEQLNLAEAGDYSITFNGGLVQKNDTGEIMAQASLSFTDVHDLAKMAQSLDLPIDILSNDVVLCLPTSDNHLTEYPEINPLLQAQPMPLADLTEERLYNKAVIGYEQTYLEAQALKIPTVIRERFEIIKTRHNLLEFMPKGITKAHGIAVLAESLGFTAEEVMTLGDEENDLAMIAYAGLGVAMGNAIPEVKALAQVITDTNENDGVAQAIEQHVLR